MIQTDRAAELRDDALAVAVGTLLFLLPAAFNGFPLIFTDTFDYVVPTPRLYRSPFYSLFVFLTGWKMSLWPVIAAQSFIASHVVTLAMRRFDMPLRPMLGTMVLLALGSSVSIYASFVMPDILTGVMFLSLYLLMFHWRENGPWMRSYLFLLACVGISCHLAHLLMAAGIITLSLLILMFQKRIFAAGKGVGAAAVASAVAAGAILSYNHVVFGVAQLSPAGRSFLMANWIEYGPARKELQETCPGAGYRLCAAVDRLPATANRLLWHPGPFNGLGGFEGMRDEADAIVAATLKHRPAEVLSVSAANFARALLSNAPAEDIVSFRATDGIDVFDKYHAQMKSIYGTSHADDFRTSLQERGAWPRRTVNFVNAVVLIAAGVILFLLTMVAIRRKDQLSSNVGLYVVAAYVGSALTCSALSGVWDRYQARVSWLLVLAVCLLLHRYLKVSRGRSGESENIR